MTTKRKTKKPGELKGKARLRSEIVELTRDMHAVGLLGDDDVTKTTLKMLGPDALPGAAPLTGKDIVSIREQARMSQAVFARVIDVSIGTLSKWERDEIKPRGPARRLLQIIKAKGVAAVL